MPIFLFFPYLVESAQQPALAVLRVGGFSVVDRNTNATFEPSAIPGLTLVQELQGRDNMVRYYLRGAGKMQPSISQAVNALRPNPQIQ